MQSPLMEGFFMEFLNKSEPYLVLARRTRPQSFSELVGQTPVVTAIENILDSRKIPHAFLLTGTRGTGKTSSARILAKSLCCEQAPTKNPCQVCVHCMQITSSSHDDILEIDGASNTGVDHIRELRESTRFYPHSARYKIFIIDEVHMLSTGAFNALLKTLEEPLPQVIFILATTELNKVPITVRSRCMIFSFKKVEHGIIAQHIKNILQKEKITFEEDAVQIIAREAKGSLRDSLSLLEQAIAVCGGQILSTAQTKKGLCVQGEELASQLFQSICAKESGRAFEVLNEADLANFEISLLIENTALLFRNALISKNLNNKERSIQLTHLLPSEHDMITEASKDLSCNALSEIFKALSLSVKEITRSSVPVSWAQVVIADCINRADWLSASDLFAVLSEKSSTISVSPINPTQKQQIATPKTEVKTQHSLVSNKINVDLYKRFIEITKSKSETLAAKLTHAKIEEFNLQIIQFANSPENEIYLNLHDQDYQIFWNSLEKLGLGKVEIKGKYLANRKASSNESQNPTLNQVIQNLNRFSAPNQTSAGEKGQINPNISLSEINQKLKSQEHVKKENHILSLDHVQNLKKLATEIHILPKE